MKRKRKRKNPVKDFDPWKPVSESNIKKAHKLVSEARTLASAWCRFFAHIIARCETVIVKPEDRTVPTACVSQDGGMFFNPNFVLSLKPSELAGVVIHEAMHPAMLCWARQQGRHEKVVVGGQVVEAWNLAHDLSINPAIQDMLNASDSYIAKRIRLPADVAIDPKYGSAWSAEMIYDDLLKRAQENTSHQGSAGQPCDGNGDGNPNGANGSLPEFDNDALAGDARSDIGNSDVGHRAAAGDKTAQSKLANDWRVTLLAAAQEQERHGGRGSLPGGIQKLVDELRNPKVDWRDVLSQWIGENGNREDFTYRRPRRRFDPRETYLPSIQKHGIDDVVVLWDTSGSMHGRETAILSELVNGICEDLGLSLRIICIDAKIHSDTRDVQEACDIIPHIKGGGGSNFRPAFERLDEEQFNGVVIAFTDGFIAVPQSKPEHIRDVLWCIEPKDRGDQDPTHGRWGQVLMMEETS